MADRCRRLFVALWPNADVRRQLQMLARDQVLSGARLTHVEDLHLTLQFLGPVAEQRVAEVQTALVGVSGSSFELLLNHVGHWPRPQVWWCAPERVPEALNRLVNTLASALEPVGFARESRPFRPHVTLARKVRRAVSQTLLTPIRWHVESFALVQSTSVANPPRYLVLRTWPLGN